MAAGVGPACNVLHFGGPSEKAPATGRLPKRTWSELAGRCGDGGEGGSGGKSLHYAPSFRSRSMWARNLGRRRRFVKTVNRVWSLGGGDYI